VGEGRRAKEMFLLRRMGKVRWADLGARREEGSRLAGSLKCTTNRRKRGGGEDHSASKRDSFLLTAMSVELRGKTDRGPEKEGRKESAGGRADARGVRLGEASTARRKPDSLIGTGIAG